MTPKTSLLALASVAMMAAAPLAARADQLADILARKELRCGTFADVPPFAAPDPKTREMVGHDVDLCNALAKRLGVAAKADAAVGGSARARGQLGRVDITVANLAYTLGRAEQIQFSDPYYLAKEMLAVLASDPGTKPADFKGKRIAATKGSTSELSIKLNGGEPVTFVDTGSVFMAVQQNKAVGMVANTMTITKLVNQSKTAGQPMKMIAEPMVFQPIGIGMKKDEPALLARVNATLKALDDEGELTRIWDKWLGMGTEFKMTRNDKVVPLTKLKFTPMP
ncbi:MAG: transporter substrate-binding domain-containing protein [Rubrivivax sp.]